MLPGGPGGVDHVGMQELPAGPLEITEEQLLDAQPRVRALLVQRYETVWSVVQGHMDEHLAGDRPVDPRMLEIGLRVLKQEGEVYRTNRLPLAAEAEDEEPLGQVLDRRALALESLLEVEVRLGKQPESGAGG